MCECGCVCVGGGCVCVRVGCVCVGEGGEFEVTVNGLITEQASRVALFSPPRPLVECGSLDDAAHWTSLTQLGSKGGQGW